MTQIRKVPIRSSEVKQVFTALGMTEEEWEQFQAEQIALNDALDGEWEASE